LHSLWGTLWGLQEKTGWSHDYILWEESWINIQMKLADAPRISTKKRKKAIETEEDLRNFLDIHD
jgi:hypothetical protein